MFDQTTRNAHERSLRATTLGCDVTACAAGLRGVRRVDLDERASRPCELVSELFDESAPSDRADAASESSANTDHVFCAQCFNDDRAVALGVGRRNAVQNMIALTADFSAEAHDTRLRFLSIARSFLATTDDTLRASESMHGVFVEARVFEDATVAVYDDVDDATIKRDDRLRSRRRVGNADFTNDGSEPLVAISLQGAGLQDTFERSMRNNAHWPEFWKMQDRTIEAPGLRMRLAEARFVSTFTLPSWLFRELCEAPLPGLIKLDEKLRANISRHIGEPRKLGAQGSQFIDLIERCWIATLTLRAPVTREALLVCEVPQGAQRVFPCAQTSFLLKCRVDTEAARLADQHKTEHSLVYASRQRLSFGSTCCLYADGSFGLCAKVSRQGHHRASVQDSARILGVDVRRLRVRPSRNKLRSRLRSPSCWVSAESRAIDAGQFAQGSVSTKVARCPSSRSRPQDVGAALLEPKLLRSVVWWRAISDRQEVRGSATRRPRFLSVVNGRVSALELP